MSRTVDRYLAKRTQSQDWPLTGDLNGACRSIVVIPSLGEYPGILDTLGDLAACDGHDEVLVIVVVNNRAPQHAATHDIKSNAQTLEALHQWDQQRLRVAWIDASSAGHELPAKEGVGLARKLGMDWGLQILADRDQLHSALICLDGDTRVDVDYLRALHQFFADTGRWAGVLPYAHPIEGDRREQAAILCYEFFLRYHAAQLTWAGSPYGYHAIGSAMTCTGEAYAAISGMNRRQAGEDFYFLQQLAKTGLVETIPGTVVMPSGRASHRVPFGTGRRVQRFLDGGENEYLLYNPDSYDVIRRWLHAVVDSPDATASQLLEAAGTVHEQLLDFLTQASFATSWDRMRQQASSEAAAIAQFHSWFDGFRTLKCIHHLRDTSCPDLPMFDAIGSLLTRLQLVPVVDLSSASVFDDFDGVAGDAGDHNARIADDLESQRRLLDQLRSQ